MERSTYITDLAYIYFFQKSLNYIYSLIRKENFRQSFWSKRAVFNLSAKAWCVSEPTISKNKHSMLKQIQAYKYNHFNWICLTFFLIWFSGTGQPFSFIRGCTDGKIFSLTDFPNRTIVSDNQTTCAFRPGSGKVVVCLTMCKTDFCNGPLPDMNNGGITSSLSPVLFIPLLLAVITSILYDVRCWWSLNTFAIFWYETNCEENNRVKTNFYSNVYVAYYM